MVFTTLNVQGSNDNVGFDAASNAERARRLQANLAWMGRAVREANAGAAALVVIVHANPLVESPGNVYEPYLAALRAAAEQLRRPVLLVHGDTHWQRVDNPFTDATGRPIANLTRLETYGSPWVGWVRVTVDRGDPRVFTFEPRPQ